MMIAVLLNTKHFSREQNVALQSDTTLIVHALLCPLDTGPDILGRF